MDDDELLRSALRVVLVDIREGTACRETTPRCRKNALARPWRAAMLGFAVGASDMGHHGSVPEGHVVRE